MTELSPAAQAVLDAAIKVAESPDAEAIAAAALLAAADQVVPDEGDCWRRDLRGDAWIRWEERKLIRAEILAIAAELKAHG